MMRSKITAIANVKPCALSWRHASFATACWMAMQVASAQTLGEALELARESDAEYLAATYAHEASRQRLPQARADLLPQLSYSRNRSRQKGTLYFGEEDPADKNVETNTRQLQLTQGIIRPDHWMAVRQALVSQKQAEHRLALAEQQLLTRVVGAYLEAWVANEGVRLSRLQLKAVESQLDLARRNFEVGATTITDVHEAQSQHDLTLAQSIEGENALQVALTNLRTITGKQFDSLHGVKAEARLPVSAIDPIDVWLSKLPSQNPEMLAAEAQTESVQAELAKEKAGFMPTLDLTVTRGRTSTDGSFTSPADLAQRTTSTQTMLSVNWRLFEGGRSYYRVKEQAALLNQALSQRDLARLNAQAEVRNSYASVRSGLAQLRALNSGLVASEKAVEASKVGYRIGTRINTDVLDAESQYFGVQRDIARAKANLLLSWTALLATVGELDDAHVKAMESILEPSAQELVPLDDTITETELGLISKPTEESTK